MGGNLLLLRADSGGDIEKVGTKSAAKPPPPPSSFSFLSSFIPPPLRRRLQRLITNLMQLQAAQSTLPSADLEIYFGAH